MEKFLRIAAQAWNGVSVNVKEFAKAYIASINKYGQQAKNQFALAYPIFGDREWRRIELVGMGILMPQFCFKSGSFINKLIRMDDSHRIQKALLSADIKVLRDHKWKEVGISDLTKGEEKALAESICDKNKIKRLYECKRIIARVNNTRMTDRLPAWEIRVVNGTVKVHFNRACDLTIAELENLLRKAKQKNV